MIRKIFAGFLVFVFIVLAVPFIAVFGIYKTFLNEDFYKGEVLDIVYELWADAAVEAIDVEDVSFSVDKEDFMEVLREVFTADDLALMIENIADEFDKAVFLEDGVIPLELSLEWVRDRSDVFAESVTGLIVDGLEPCKSINEFDADKFNCIPEGFSISTVKDEVQADLKAQLLKDIPESYSFDVKTGLDLREGEDVSDYVDSIIHDVFFIGSLVLLFVLLLLALVVFRPAVRILKWEMKAIFLASFLPLIAFLILSKGVDKIKIEGAEEFFELFSFIIKAFSNTLISYLIPVAAVSFVFWIVGIIFDKKNEPARTK